MFANSYEAIEAFKDFESRCSAARSVQIDRIKEDRDFLAGEQWDQSDNLLWDSADKRPRRVVNILSNSVNSVQSQYASYPYKFYSSNERVDQTCSGFLRTGSNSRAAYDALGNAIAFGLGYIAIGSEKVENTEIPALYSIDSVENILWDPESVEIDGRDAVEAAIVEYKSRSYIRAKFGDEYLPSEGKFALVNTGSNKNPNVLCIVTYYRINKGACEVYSLLGDDYFAEPVVLPLNRPPIFPIYGERTWHDGKPIWQGLVRKGTPIQKLVNESFTQLSERIAIAPKPTWLTDPRATEGYEEGYKFFNRNLNSLLFYNPASDDGKIQYQQPQRLDNRVQFDDLTGIISSNLGLLSTITGVDSRGLLDNKSEITATEVIFNEKQILATVRGYFANLRDSFKACGECVCKLLGLGDVSLEVIQGPQEYLELQVARQQLAALAPMVPESDRMKLVNGILMSHNDNAILRNVFGMLNSTPQPTPMEQEALDTVETMKKAIEDKDAQLREMADTIQRYEQGDRMKEQSMRQDVLMEDLRHQHRMEEMAVKAEIEGGADTEKTMVETRKQQVELEREAVKLDQDKVKLGQDKVELAKSVMGV